jgi:large subunit ribosomal protein L31
VKQGIHPEYVVSTVHCSCGNKFETRSTRPELHVELCSECHPFYTGKQKFVDTGGRVQRFSDKFGNAAAATLEREAAEKVARQKAADEAADKAKTERESRVAAKAERVEKATREDKAAQRESRSDKFVADAADEAEVVAEATDAVEAVEAVEEPVAEEAAE